MDIFEVIKSTDGIVAVSVMVYFGTRLIAQLQQLQDNQMNIISKLIDLCADADEKT